MAVYFYRTTIPMATTGYSSQWRRDICARAQMWRRDAICMARQWQVTRYTSRLQLDRAYSYCCGAPRRCDFIDIFIPSASLDSATTRLIRSKDVFRSMGLCSVYAACELLARTIVQVTRQTFASLRLLIVRIACDVLYGKFLGHIRTLQVFSQRI